MTQQLDIFKKIKKAMHTSCDDALFFSNDETQLINAEYLLTVNIAKAIKELNFYFGTPYKIYLEHDTKQLASASTPFCVIDPLTLRNTIRTKNNTTRSGRVDIAVYNQILWYDTPVCAIEVKGFNPPKHLIVKDLERNSEYFSFTSPTGSSTMPFTFFIALHSFKGVWNDEKEIFQT